MEQLAGATGLFFAMYFGAIGMPKDTFRATISMAMVAIALVRGLGYLAIGGYTRDFVLILAITLPMALIGIFIGERIQTGLSEPPGQRDPDRERVCAASGPVAVGRPDEHNCST